MRLGCRPGRPPRRRRRSGPWSSDRIVMSPMSHPLVLALFPSPAAAAAGARAVHATGVTRDRISIVSRNHDEEGAFAEQMDGTPGIRHRGFAPSRAVRRVVRLLAAIALVLPGIGSIVAAGPLSAGLGEAAGHVAGGVASVLTGAGVSESRAVALQRAVEQGSVLIGVHAEAGTVAAIRDALRASGATEVETANWSEVRAGEPPCPIPVDSPLACSRMSSGRGKGSRPS